MESSLKKSHFYHWHLLQFFFPVQLPIDQMDLFLKLKLQKKLYARKVPSKNPVFSNRESLVVLPNLSLIHI